MAEDKKRGLFGRLFKGKQKPTADMPEETRAPQVDDVSDPDPSVLDFAPGRPTVYQGNLPEEQREVRDPRLAKARRAEAERVQQKPAAIRVDPAGEATPPPLPTHPPLPSPDRRSEERKASVTLAERLRGKRSSDISEPALPKPAPLPEATPPSRTQDDLEDKTDWRDMFEEKDNPTPSLAPNVDNDAADAEPSDHGYPMLDDDRDKDVSFSDRFGDADDEEQLDVVATTTNSAGEIVHHDDPQDNDDEHDSNREQGGGPEKKTSWFTRLREGLARTSSNLAGSIGSIFTKGKLDDETLEELEDALIQADLGIDAAVQITEALAKGRYNKEISGEEVKSVLASEIESMLAPIAEPLVVAKTATPQVILMVGVNGSGKTTTIGKLAQKFTREGRSVMLAAGDTFRAAAIEQLKIWGQRTGSPVVARDTGADAAGLAFDAMKDARAAGSDILLIDTAGRLQNKAELMAELEKVVRVIKKHDPSAPHHVLLTLDATTGQNALSQADAFGKSVGVTGLVMTKLDGTARGGILVAIAQKHGLPVHFIGVGESAEDLQPFAAKDFARAIAGLD